VPVTVVTSDTLGGEPSDPRVARDPAVRERFRAGQLALAERFDTRLVVVDGDEWVPTYRPDRLAEIILSAIPTE